MDILPEFNQTIIETDLFRNMRTDDLKSLLTCLSASVVHFKKEAIILQQGQTIDRFGVVLAGQVQIYENDYYGNKNILSNVSAGDIFAESFAFSENSVLPVSVSATMSCTVLFINSERLVTSCSRACTFHTQLIQNMMRIMAEKNSILTQKIRFITKRTLREKLLAYLSSQALKAQSNRFVIPFDRQELADFLAVDRSAVSAVLSKLRDEGILKFRKNMFELL
jgi:CRP-like cAMP-binding protein